MKDFIDGIGEPRDLDLATSFLAPLQGAALLVGNPGLALLTGCCAAGILLSLPCLFLGLITVPVFMSIAVLAVVAAIEDPGEPPTRVLPLACANLRARIGVFTIMALFPLLLAVIAFCAARGGPFDRAAYASLAYLCFALVYGVAAAHAVILAGRGGASAASCCVAGIDLLFKKPALLFGQLLIWLMGLAFCLAVMFSYMIVIPWCGVAPGTPLYLVCSYLLLFLVLTGFLAFYLTGVAVLMWRWFGPAPAPEGEGPAGDGGDGEEE